MNPPGFQHKAVFSRLLYDLDKEPDGADRR